MRAFLVLSLTVLLSSCVHTVEPTAPAPPPVQQTFQNLVDEFFATSFAWSPVTATAVGVHQYDSKLDDRSREAYQRRLQELREYAQKLRSLDWTQLDFNNHVDAKALAAHMDAEIFRIETLRSWEQNPMGYASLPGEAIDVLIKRDFAPAQERLQHVIRRLQGLPDIYQAARENLKNPPREFTQLAMRMAQGSVGFFAQSLPLWAKKAAAGDQLLWQKFQLANQNAVEESRRFVEWLKHDLLPRSQGSYAIGSEAFQKLLAYEEMVATPLPELLLIGEAQLKKDYDAFLNVAQSIDPQKTAAQVMRSLSDEHPEAQDLLPSVRRTLEEARSFLASQDLITIPSERRPLVEETPAYDRSGSFASMDTPGPEELHAKEAFYYVTPVEPGWSDKHKDEHLRAYNPYVVAMINVHEAFPGHYLQFLYASQFPSKVRKLVHSSSNAEGWAHYTEQMMVEQGFGQNNPKFRLAQLQEALLRDCRFIVGIKLHSAGWTVEQGAEFFAKYAFQEPANAYEEARRGTYNPTYLAYTLGKLEIQKLRDDYIAHTGASLKEFHDAFVSQGALPLPLVRDILFHEGKPREQAQIPEPRGRSQN